MEDGPAGGRASGAVPPGCLPSFPPLYALPILQDPAFLRGLVLASIVTRRLTTSDLASAGTVTAADGQQLPVKAQSGGKRFCSRCLGGRMRVSLHCPSRPAQPPKQAATCALRPARACCRADGGGAGGHRSSRHPCLQWHHSHHRWLCRAAGRCGSGWPRLRAAQWMRTCLRLHKRVG